MTSLSLHATRLTMTVADVNRLRSWAVLAREQMGEQEPGWTLEDKKLLTYLDETLISANELLES